MRTFNQHMLIGYLAADPEISTVGSGKSVAKFTITTDEGYKDRTSNEWVNVPNYQRCIAWEKLADIIVQLQMGKGDLVMSIGRVTTRSYEQDGVTKYFTEHVSNTLNLIKGKDRSESNSQSKSRPQKDDGDNVPF